MFSVRGERCGFVGMVHLQPLPGSPKNHMSMSKILNAAVLDAEALIEGGCDALLVENMGDLPYLKGRVDPETVAAMSLAVHRMTEFGVPVGLQILAGANREALGVAAVTGASFIRAEAFAYGHVADEGWMDACAGQLLRARHALGASVDIWADVQKKHAAHSVTADLSIQDLAAGAVFCGADALVITGSATGQATDVKDIEAARSAGVPIIVGSGVNLDNVQAYSQYADALIVGSYLKRDGDWRNEVDVARVRGLRARLDTAQSG